MTGLPMFPFSLLCSGVVCGTKESQYRNYKRTVKREEPGASAIFYHIAHEKVVEMKFICVQF